MKIVAVTSMSKEYYARCGWAMIDSYVTHMANDIPLVLYNENFSLGHSAITEIGWELGKDYSKFCRRWASKSNARILTFAKKAYSIIHAMNNIDCDRLIWIDADCVIKQPFDSDIIAEIMPESALASYFGVWHEQDGREYFSCETGFFVLNKTHRLFNKFARTYSEIYNNDDYHNLRRFYDGEVFGETVLRLQQEGAEFLDLSPSNKKYKTPMGKSIIKDYLTHYKAGLKDQLADDFK